MSATIDVAELKRSITIAGHRTSISLEPEFWQALQNLSRERGRPLSAIVAEIDRARAKRNLSSALRVWVLDQLMHNTRN
jgi:predicted DNA-binding ribbon-helix-helix protein